MLSPTIYRRFRIWSNAGIFKLAWKTLLGMYSKKKLKKNVGWFKNIYIDSTQVKNINGQDCVGPNPTDRGRLGTKVSVICDNDQVPIACIFYGANVSDARTTLETVENIGCPLRKDRRTTIDLIGDKGYISKDVEISLCLNRINLVTPFRKNSRNRPYTSAKTKKKLKDRRKIENTFCRMDKFKRIFARQEQTIGSFMSWNFLACALMTGKYID